MNELEKKFSCLCGSEVKEANRKAHEKTKKHTNYQQTHGTSNLMPVHNLPVPRAVRKLQTKRKYDEQITIISIRRIIIIMITIIGMIIIIMFTYTYLCSYCLNFLAMLPFNRFLL